MRRQITTFATLFVLPLVLTIFGQWKLVAQPVEGVVTITPLSINTSADEFAPHYVLRGDLLMFTSTRKSSTGRKGDQRIWFSKREKGNNWGDPVAVDEALGSAKHVGSATITPDGNYMIFAAYEWESESNTLRGEGRTDLYSAERRGGTWTNIQNLGVIINSPYWDSQPSLSADGQLLYFTSDRPNGFGGTDIYVSRRSATGWTAPENLGSGVNSLGNEMSPVISADGVRLFFSSNGHGGEGGYDLFTTDEGNPFDGTWKSIINLGTPINSSSDEHFFYPEPNSKNGYFSSNREGSFDIYLAFPNPFPPSAQVVVFGKILDDRTKKPVEASVTVSDLETGEVIANFRSDDQSGEYTVVLTKGRRYTVTADAPGYLFYSDAYTVPEELDEGEEIEKNILLREGSTRLLIYFDYDKAELRPESYPDLQRAVDFLQRNRDLSVEIAGHTDSIGSDTYNKGLSQRRAEAVREYMISKGVNRNRLKANGYGEEQPVSDNGTDQGRALNRRVEMRVSRE